jgi:TP901 family phage tail tape measure protein
MAGTAELNVVINLVSKLRDQVPGLTQDAEKVAKVIEEILAKPATAGTRFAELFDFSGKDVEEQIRIINNAIRFLEEALSNIDLKKEFDAKGINTDKIQAALKGLGQDAIAGLSPIASKLAEIIGKMDQAELAAVSLKHDLSEISRGSKGTAAPESLQDLKQNLEEMKNVMKALKKEKKALLQGEVTDTKIATDAEVKIVQEGQDKEVKAVEEGSKRKRTARKKEVTPEAGGVAADTSAASLLAAWKTYEAARVKLNAEALRRIEADEVAATKKVIDAWKNVQTTLEKTFPKSSTREVIIAFKGKASPVTDLTTTITNVKNQVKSIQVALSNLKATVHLSEAAKEIDQANTAAKGFNATLEATDKILEQAKQDTAQLKVPFSEKNTLFESIAKEVDRVKAAKNDIIEIEEAAAQKKIAIAERAAAAVTKAELTGEEKLAAAMRLRVDASRVAADRRLGIERETFNKIAAIYQGLMKSEAELKAKEIAAWRAAAEEKRKLKLQELQEQQRLAQNAAFNKVQSGTNRYDESLARARENIARVTAELTKLDQKIELQKKHEYVIKVLLEASPAVPFSEGIANLKKSLAGLPDEATLTIKVVGLQKAVDDAEDAAVQIAQAQQRIADARLLKESAMSPEAKKMAEEEMRLAKEELAAWTTAYRERSQVATAMYNEIKAEAKASNAEQEKIIKEVAAENKQAAKGTAEARKQQAKEEEKLLKELAKESKRIFSDMAKDRKAKAKEEEAIVKATIQENLVLLRNLAAQKRALNKEEQEQQKKIWREISATQKAQMKESIILAKEAALSARKALDDAVGSGSLGSSKKVAESYNAIKKEIKNLEALQRQAALAAKTGNLEVAGSLDKNVKESMLRVEGELKKLGLSWDQVKNSGLDATKMWEDRMTTMSYRFSHIGFQLGIVGAAATAVFVKPLEAQKEFQKSIEYTNAILGGSQEQMEQLRKTALELGSTTIYSSQQIADGMRALAQAGLSAEEAMKGVKPLLDFASAGMLNLDEAARIAISTMNQFGLSLADLPDITNQIQAAANKTNAEVKDFGEALKNVGPTAKAVGASLKETNLALGVLSQAGINASTAGTQLRGVYRRLLEASNEGSKAGKIFKELGLSVTDAAGNFKELEVILQELKAATADMSEVERAAKVYEIFGQRAGGPAVIAMLNAGQGAFDKLKKSIAEAADAQAIAAQRGEGLWGTLEKLKNSFTALIQEIGYSEGSFLKGLIDGLVSFVNAVRTALQMSPALKAMVTGFLSLSAVAGAIFLVSSAFALMASNILSVLGVAGPAKKMLDTLILTMKGYTAEQIALQAAQKGAIATTGAQIVATNGLTASFKALGVAQRAVLVIMAALAAFEVGQAIYQWVKGITEANEQIDELGARVEKFKLALEKPVTTKAQFALYSEEQKKAEIKRASEAKQALTALIEELNVKIAKKRRFFGDTKELEKELTDATKRLKEWTDTEGWLRIKPTVDQSASTKVKKDIVTLIEDADILFGNSKLGIKKFDIGKVVDEIQKARDTFWNFAQTLDDGKASAATKELQGAFKDLGLAIDENTAGRLQSIREFNDKALSSIVDYYTAAMDETKNYLDESGSVDQELFERRNESYADTITALEDMYTEARTKMDEYSADIIQAEKDLAEARVEAHNWYLDQIEVSDKVKTAKRKAEELRAARDAAIAQAEAYSKAGDTKRFEAQVREAMKLEAELGKAVKDELAAIAQAGIKAEEKLGIAREKLGDVREKREQRIADKQASNSEAELRRSNQIEEAERRLADIRERQGLAKTEKERLSLRQQEEAVLRRISELERRSATDSEKAARSLGRLSSESAREENLKDSTKELEAQAAALHRMEGSSDELMRKTAQYAREQDAVREGVVDIEGTTALAAEHTRVSLTLSNLLVAAHEQEVTQLKAAREVWVETATQAGLTKAAVEAVNNNFGNLKIAENGSEELKKLQAEFAKQELKLSLKAESKDERIFEILDIASGKKLDIKVPLKLEGAKALDTTLRSLFEATKKDFSITAKIDPEAKRAVDDFKKDLGKTINLNVDASAAKAGATEIDKLLTSTFVKVERDGKAVWTNIAKEGERVFTTFDIESGAMKAGESYGVLLTEGISKETKNFNPLQGFVPAEQGATDAQAYTASLAKEVVPGATVAATNVSTALTTGVQTAATATVEIAKTAGEEAGTSWAGKFGEFIGQGLGTATRYIVDWGKSLIDYFGNLVLDLVRWLFDKESWKAGIRSLISLFKDDLPAGLKIVFKELGKGLYLVFIEPFKKFGEFLKGVLKGFKFTFSGTASETKDEENKPTGRFGGLVSFARGMAQGGHLPGYGGGDRHLTLLESGEYVLPKEAVRGIGVDTLNAIRALFLRGLGLPSFTVGIPRMATGGLVQSAAGGAGLYTLNLNINGGKYPMYGEKAVIEAFMNTMKKEGMTRR